MIRGTVYFALVFSVGFVLGFVRVLWIVPRLGDRTAELIEAPLMLITIYIAARFINRRFVAAHTVEYLFTGLFALLLLLCTELSVVLGLQGLGIREYLAERDPVAGVVYLVMLIIFAVMPWWVAKTRVVA